VDLRFSESEKALVIATHEMTRRLEGMNEIRSQLDRQAATFLSREAHEIEHASLEQRLNALEHESATAMGSAKTQIIVVAAFISVFVSVLSGILVYYLTR
jgi:hypothetical protein